MDRAIESQPEMLRAVLELEIGEVVDRLGTGSRIWLIGTGTSQHAADLGARMLRLAGVDAAAGSAASFARRRPQVSADDSIVLISHTGETAFAQSVRQQAISRGAVLVSITARGVDWPEALAVAPREKSETYTASYTAALLVLARIGGELGANELNHASLSAVPSAVQEALEDALPEISPRSRLVAIAGWGPGATTAREGALKVREAARLIAEGYEAEYLLHGSAVPLGASDELIMLQPDADPDGLLPALGAAAADQEVKVAEIQDLSPLDELLLQIPLTVRLQRLASRLAAAARQDPDQVIVGGWADDALWSYGSAPRS